MKKLSILLIVSMMFILIACKPDGMSDKAYDLGCNALEIIEKYEAGDIDKDTAHDRLDQIANSLCDTGDNNDLYMGTKIDSITFGIVRGADIYDDVESLKKMLNK